ncbi:nucleotide exchange factor GrpE [Flavobacteriaceae bacterium]|nr:nucleotide exchange factor GrpE [Flavobacteriaceae bacterium]
MTKKEAPQKDSKSKKETKKKDIKSKVTDQIDALKKEIEQEKDKYLRLFAEFENFKKRTAKERIELFKTANQEVIIALIPVLDDFNRANQQMEKAKGGIDQEGIQLIYNKFSEVLKTNGLKQTEEKIGDSFDAELHEAITQIPAPKKEDKGKIIDIVELGYQLGDRIIRYPKVVVGQ